MTQKEDVVALQRHKDWVNNRATGKQADLRGADLRKVNFEGADLRFVDFRAADLSGSNLTRADCRHADFRGAQMSGVNLGNRFQRILRVKRARSRSRKRRAKND